MKEFHLSKGSDGDIDAEVRQPYSCDSRATDPSFAPPSMKTSLVLALTFFTGVLTFPRIADADSITEIKAPIRLEGLINNGRARQSVSANMNGSAEYGLFDLKVNVEGRILSTNRGRPVQRHLFGSYPVEMKVRAKRSGLSASRTVKTSIYVSRHWIRFGKYGQVTLDRSLRPTAKGRQVLRGKGTLRYNF